MRLKTVLLGSGVAGVMLACSNAPPAPHVVLEGGDLTPLRTAFNADAGKVRAIFLASPT